MQVILQLSVETHSLIYILAFTTAHGYDNANKTKQEG